jgi:hypothetical protein
MEIIYNAIETTLKSFDFSFCISVNVATYIIINTLISFKKKDISIWFKRSILLLCILFIGTIYYLIDNDIKLIINSSILAPVFWSWIIKPICKYFKIDYKNIDI